MTVGVQCKLPMIYDQVEIPPMEQQIPSSIMHIWRDVVEMDKIFNRFHLPHLLLEKFFDLFVYFSEEIFNEENEFFFFLFAKQSRVISFASVFFLFSWRLFLSFAVQHQWIPHTVANRTPCRPFTPDQNLYRWGTRLWTPSSLYSLHDIYHFLIWTNLIFSYHWYKFFIL